MKKLFAAMVHVAAGLLAIVPGAAWAQDYPTRAIRIVVAYPPGGSNDFLARLFAPRLTDLLGRQVVVDNRAGGNTIIGNDHVAKATPDGHTLLLGGSTQLALPHLYRNIPYDTLRDFVPIAGIARSEFVLVVHPALPVVNLKEFIALAKKRPGELNYGTSSTGGPTHLAAVLFQMQSGAKIQQVPYKGAGPALIDLMAGHIQSSFGNAASVTPLVNAKRLKALAVTGEKRLESMPDVPTFDEAGLPGLLLRNWYAITAPAGTPKAIVEKLAATVAKISAMPETKVALVRQGLDSYYVSPEQIDAMRREDMAIVGKVIRAAGLKIQD
jgi:tripartite-type tricarboxylate transporter receptor subunit TctC